MTPLAYKEISGVSVRTFQSQFARGIMRRNYRFLRQRGVSVLVARIVLDSTARLDAGLDERHVDLEQREREAVA